MSSQGPSCKASSLQTHLDLTLNYRSTTPYNLTLPSPQPKSRVTNPTIKQNPKPTTLNPKPQTEPWGPNAAAAGPWGAGWPRTLFRVPGLPSFLNRVAYLEGHRDWVGTWKEYGNDCLFLGFCVEGDLLKG